MERKNEGEKKSCGQGRLSRRPDELSGLCTDVPVPVQREGDRGHTSLEAPPVPSQPSSSHPLLSHSLRRPTTTSSSSSSSSSLTRSPWSLAGGRRWASDGPGAARGNGERSRTSGARAQTGQPAPNTHISRHLIITTHLVLPWHNSLGDLHVFVVFDLDEAGALPQ